MNLHARRLSEKALLHTCRSQWFYRGNRLLWWFWIKWSHRLHWRHRHYRQHR